MNLCRVGRSLRPGANRLECRRQLHLQQYVAEELLRQHGVPLWPSKAASSVEEVAVAAEEALRISQEITLRAQVLLPAHEHTEARWDSGLVGLEHKLTSVDASRKTASRLLRHSAASSSTAHSPLPCSKITIHPAIELQDGCSLLLFPSRETGTPIFRATSSAQETVELALDINDDSMDRTALGQCLRGLSLGRVEKAVQELSEAVQHLWTFYRKHDVLRLQITAGLDSVDQTVRLLNPAVHIDPFALYRQPELAKLADPTQMSSLEQRAKEDKLFYVKKPVGNIGSFGFGAGVAMSTMDALALAGGKAANFLDGGGGATPENVRAAVNLLLDDGDVEVIFINSFGGLTKTNVLAEGLVAVLRERRDNGIDDSRIRKVIVRLRGTGSEEAEQIIMSATDLPKVVFIPDMWTAAQEAASAAM